jgi:glycosyltransferase involved in cell wall biosynthesis
VVRSVSLPESSRSISVNDTPAKPRVHVLFIIDQLCEPGGAERMLLSTIRLLPSAHFRCSLMTFKIDTNVELFKELPCPLILLPLRRTYDWQALKTAKQIRKFIREEHVQIVHTFHETSDLWAGLVAKMSAPVALVSSRRDMGILRSAKHNVGYRLMNSKFDLVLTVSEEVRQFCIGKDALPPEKVATLWNGLELDKIPSRSGAVGLRSILEVEPATPIIATVGHVRRVKGFDVLVETAGIVTKKFPQAVFLIIGRNSESEYSRQLAARITELDIQRNVRFFGESEKISSLLNMCDIFFLPSRSEGFSNALIEAMACSLPCVATRVGGNAEAIEEGRSGFLVENEDARAAADRIVSLLEEPSKAKTMGLAGRETVAHKFTADAMIDRLTQHYGRLLSARSN